MIVMDTHIWLWWVNRDIDLLGNKRTEFLGKSNPLAVSAISDHAQIPDFSKKSGI
jgi:PIN domain nuclease of toxin-antitoxin system